MYILNHVDGLRCAFICGKKCPFGAASPKGRSTCGPSAPGAVHWWTLRSCGVHWWTLHRPLQEWPLVDHPPHGSTGGLATTGEVHWWILHYEGGIRWRASPSSGMSIGGLLHSRGCLLVDQPLQGGPLVGTPLLRWCAGGPSVLRDDIWGGSRRYGSMCVHMHTTYIYIYICVCMYIRIYTHTHTRAYEYDYMYVYGHMR